MKELIIGKWCMVRGLYSGTYAGIVDDCSDDFRVIKLSNARQIRRIVSNDTSGGLAKALHCTPAQKPDIEKIDYNNGSIFLTENYEVFPLDDEAVDFLNKYSL